MGPMHQRRLAVARAMVWARDGGASLPSCIGDVTPGMVSTTVPLRWATALAARLEDAGSVLGQQIAEELLDVYGEHAKEALRAAAAGPGKRLASGARRLLAEVRFNPRHDVRL